MPHQELFNINNIKKPKLSLLFASILYVGIFIPGSATAEESTGNFKGHKIQPPVVTTSEILVAGEEKEPMYQRPAPEHVNGDLGTIIVAPAELRSKPESNLDSADRTEESQENSTNQQQNQQNEQNQLEDYPDK